MKLSGTMVYFTSAPEHPKSVLFVMVSQTDVYLINEYFAAWGVLKLCSEQYWPEITK